VPPTRSHAAGCLGCSATSRRRHLASRGAVAEAQRSHWDGVSSGPAADVRPDTSVLSIPRRAGQVAASFPPPSIRTASSRISCACECRAQLQSRCDSWCWRPAWLADLRRYAQMRSARRKRTPWSSMASSTGAAAKVSHFRRLNYVGGDNDTGTLTTPTAFLMLHLRHCVDDRGQLDLVALPHARQCHRRQFLCGTRNRISANVANA